MHWVGVGGVVPHRLQRLNSEALQAGHGVFNALHNVLELQSLLAQERQKADLADAPQGTG